MHPKYKTFKTNYFDTLKHITNVTTHDPLLYLTIEHV